MKIIGKFFLGLAIIFVLIHPLSADELNKSSNYSGVNILASSYVSTNLTFNKTVQITIDPVTKREYVTDQVIVRFKSQKKGGPTISNDKIRTAHAKVGAKVKKDFSSEGVSGLQVVQLANGTDVQSAIKEYQSNPDVLYAEPDYVISISPDQAGPIVQEVNPLQILSTPNEPRFTELWGLHNTGQTGGTPGADINATAAWDITTGSNNVIVAVIDTGVLYNHSDLSTNIWTNLGEIPLNGVDDDHNSYIDDVHGWNFVTDTFDPVDDSGHGTHVSGTIGAVGNNAVGVAGVTWHVKIMALKVFDASGNGLTSNAISAILYANANGASVISNSWSGSDYDQALKDVIDVSPAVVVCSAGNIDAQHPEPNNDLVQQYPASFLSANIISVAATDKNDQLASFSHYGPISIDLAAPGVNILSTLNVAETYGNKSGTSMATPHVSGVAALVKSVNPELTNVQIKNMVLNNVDVIPSLVTKVNTSGRLNAYKAVLAALGTLAPVPDFSGNPVEGVAPLTVQFTDLSANLPRTWLWAFGDGNTTNSTEQSPIHTYTNTGSYTVSLNVSNAYGFSNVTKNGCIVVMRYPAFKIGVFRNGIWFVDWNGNGTWDTVDAAQIEKAFGQAGDIPVAGDWINNGKTKIGIFRGGHDWYLDFNGNETLDTFPPDVYYGFGMAGDVPVTGDWNGDGLTEIGVLRGGHDWYLDYNRSGTWESDVIDRHYGFGMAGDVPVTGDWDGDGITEIGVLRGGHDWYLDYNRSGTWEGDMIDRHYGFGMAGDVPATGDWNGDGVTEIGVLRGGHDWYVDYNRTGTWEGILVDRHYGFGMAGDVPVTGKW